MSNLPQYPTTLAEKDWKGLTLEEMQVQRALVQARMEIQKYHLANHVNAINDGSPLLSGSKSSLFGRIAGAISIVEYAAFAVKVFRLVSPIFKKK